MAEVSEMKRFVQGDNRTQSFLLPEALDDYVTDANPVRVVDVFVDELDLQKLGFEGVEPALTGRPSYHPEVMLKIYIYGYLNRIQSSRRLEREAQRNVELMWLTGRLAPDFKTIARFRKDNGKAIRSVCRQFVMLCQRLDLFAEALVAIDGSKFKAVNHRDRNFTSAKLERRMRDIEASISRYLVQMDTADRESKDRTAARQDCGSQGADAKPQASRSSTRRSAGQASVAHGPGRALDEDARDRRRRLQRSSSGRSEAPSDCRARGHQQRH